ncbi:MAG: hypothetical protein JEZ14_19085 [Marinilabiliaceae bacterium]|nr:hypothetical protein [Marinilabiliaceae bacterium]
MSLNLFSTKPAMAGFRLHTFEIWNWGTFDNQVWRIEAHGETSLLTGANASGKTTMVDGLLTLLVPERRMRFYNQTAGTKGERSEESYLTGEYGEADNPQTNSVEIKRLRSDKASTQSVLLAVFQSEDEFVTLAQGRWYSNDELKRTFIFATTRLSIEADFSPFDNQGVWKRRLRDKYPKIGDTEVVSLTNSPKAYGQMMRQAFGMRSAKAHTLFSQTIGLKVLGNLDDFVRRQMLEEPDVEVEFQKLSAFFKTLCDAHSAIEKACAQIELLTPISAKADDLKKLKIDLQQQENSLSIVPLWFAKKQIQIITEEEKQATVKKQQFEDAEFLLNTEIESSSQQERDLDLLIKNDQKGQQITLLEQQIKSLKNTQKERQEELDKYNALAAIIGLESNPQSQAQLDSQQQKAFQLKTQKIAWSGVNEQERLDLYAEQQKHEERLQVITKEMDELQRHSHNITGGPARIRHEIVTHLGISESELPFIGELIKVKDAEVEWEVAIEKLMHHFALRLLVSEKHYEHVNKYVNAHDLKGKIVYHKYEASYISNTSQLNQSQQALICKLDCKESFYKAWIEKEIMRLYNYSCVDTLDEFQNVPKAIMKTGLIKNHSRHEKDDRPQLRSRQQFVLGWDNENKKQALQKEVTEMQSKLYQLNQSLDELVVRREGSEKENEALTRFMDFSSFARIDMSVINHDIQKNNQQLQDLQQANLQVNALNTQREKLLQQLDTKKQELYEVTTQRIKLENQISQKKEKLVEVSETLSAYADQDLSKSFSRLEAAYDLERSFSLKSLERTQKKILDTIGNEIEKLKDLFRQESSQAESMMRLFTQPDKSISDQFEDWHTDTQQLTVCADCIEQYITLLKRIKDQELIEHRQQFKTFLNEEMITRMTDFQIGLLQQEEDIEMNINTLNQSLEKINFKSHPPTFIRLHTVKDYSTKVKAFKTALNQWKPNWQAIGPDQEEGVLEDSFLKIKTLLEELMQDDSYRKEVLDVRNWLKFKAIEYHRSDPSKIQRSYTGTAKLSGGEGAQLTYTILGSAIAYQFGIHNQANAGHSFRFICVDEAFSKQDDEKARFLMELCKQLELQLMVVSPAKAEEVAIVEPYIARVHFVQRRNNRESVVLDMPIKQLKG